MDTLKSDKIKFETVRVHFSRDIFGLLSSRNFATLAKWHNDFSSLLRTLKRARKKHVHELEHHKISRCSVFTYVTVFKQPTFSSPVHTKDVFKRRFKQFSKMFVLISVFGRFCVYVRRKRIKTYAFSSEHALEWIALRASYQKVIDSAPVWNFFS